MNIMEHVIARPREKDQENPLGRYRLMRNMRKIYKLRQNDIPVDIRRKAELMAKAMFNSKPIANDELRKKYDRKSKSE